jgi:hypothetical protein
MRRFPVNCLDLALVWVVAMAWSPGTFADIYKWVDQKGVTNYSSSPPASGKARTLNLETTSVSVYQAPSPQDSARLLDALMRQRVAILEYQLRAERMARLASYQIDADHYRLVYEQCLRERRVDCDGGRAGTYASPYFYASAPLVVGRPFPFTTPMTTFTRTTPAGFSQPGGSMRTTGYRGSSQRF